jgi:hypothetical protein
MNNMLNRDQPFISDITEEGFRANHWDTMKDLSNKQKWRCGLILAIL